MWHICLMASLAKTLQYKEDLSKRVNLIQMIWGYSTIIILFISFYTCNKFRCFPDRKAAGSAPRSLQSKGGQGERQERERVYRAIKRPRWKLTKQIWFEHIAAKLYKLFSNYDSYFPFWFNCICHDTNRCGGRKLSVCDIRESSTCVK